MSASTSALFQPITVGDVALQHRIVMAPLTRFRAGPGHVLGELSREYYEQRASAPGTLLLTEATLIAPQAGGYRDAPGIWSEEQIAGWKKIVDSVHAKGSFIYLQLWALGRGAEKDVSEEEGGYPYTSSGDKLLAPFTEPPRPMTVDEIHQFIGFYVAAARNAVEKAGFDGVEVHMANGYLLDQFLQTNTNNRTDAYGGSIENRLRFPLAVLDAVVAAVGVKKTGLRISPWAKFQDMGMDDPVPTYSTLVQRVRDTHPDLSYLHVVEPRIDGIFMRDYVADEPAESNDFIREIWGDRRIISAGGYTRASGIEAAEKTGNLIAYGRAFIANPDLVRRLKEDVPLNFSNRPTYFTKGAVGYTDYPFAPAAAIPDTPKVEPAFSISTNKLQAVQA
ncbi:NADH:flavin oxidoreductase/NADH oxidase [Auriscalpium vulgare]|uniref:NADH:flavin oxidoreductase/NADH oxidase n=1 Tax=Auriscalpium vulgare TaxID=40419 RepID=A0ACB8S168_9AGAM|nr:NADH:flavin oxidoreductase/NADH oxidase [Auriscalpium vulgare]